jgi:hypothetical protein
MPLPSEAMRMAETWLRLAEPPTGNKKPEDGKE